jgi:hypothetical protein
VIRPTILALSILVLGVCPKSTAEDEQKQIIWMDEAHTRAYFVPEAVLAADPLAVLPLSESQRLDLSGRIKWSQSPNRIPLNPLGVIHDCYPQEGKLRPGSAPNPVTIPELVAKFPVAAIGVVESVVPGWVTISPRVARLAYVRIATPLREEMKKLRPGQRVAALFTGGEIHVRGVRLCSETKPDLYQPARGDRVLLVGVAWPADDRFIDAVYTLPVRDGIIQCEPYPSLRIGCFEAEAAVVRHFHGGLDGGE